MITSVKLSLIDKLYKQKLRHFNTFFSNKNCLYSIVQAAKQMSKVKSNVPYGSATLKGCTAPSIYT
nr:MAG TPA: hypothetical protein [Caudoviricetes sp.]